MALRGGRKIKLDFEGACTALLCVRQPDELQAAFYNCNAEIKDLALGLVPS